MVDISPVTGGLVSSYLSLPAFTQNSPNNSIDLLGRAAEMVPVLAGLPAFLSCHSMDAVTLSPGFGTTKAKLFMLKRPSLKVTAQIWPVRRRPITFPGKSSHVLKHVLTKA